MEGGEEGGKGSRREGKGDGGGGTWQPPPPLPAALPGLLLRGGESRGDPLNSPAQPGAAGSCVSTSICAHPRALPIDGCIYSRGLHALERWTRDCSPRLSQPHS